MKQFSLICGVDSSFFYPMHPPRHCFHCCSLNPGGGSFFFLGFFFKGGESTDLVSCSWTLFLSRLDPTRVQVMMSPLLSWLWDTTLNESRGDFITWTLVGSSLDKKRVHEGGLSKSSNFYHYLKVAILLAENVTSFTRASDCRIPPLFITGVRLSAADFSYIFHPHVGFHLSTVAKISRAYIGI